MTAARFMSGKIFDLLFHSHAGGLHRTRDADVIAVSSN